MSSISNIFKTSRERRAYQFFQERSSKQLSGLYECEFWSRTILQAIFTDPGIRCAVVALGSLHEGYEQTGNAKDSHDDFALKQYNAAIRHHIDLLSGLQTDPDKVDNYVASCMIFVCIEILQGHYQSALSLVRGAVQLFYQHNGSLSILSAWPLEVLESLLSRLQAQAIGLIGYASIGATVPPRLKRTAFPPCIPEVFSSAEEAKDYHEFYSHTHALTQVAPNQGSAIGNPHSPQFNVYLDILSRWSAAFKGLIASRSDEFTDKEQRAVNTMKIWQIMTYTGIAMHLEYQATRDDQCLWDNFEESHKQVVTLAEQVLKGIAGQDASHKVIHRFTLDVGVVGPLYDLARVCRDPLIRRKAIALLRKYPVREGLWDSMLAARTAERQMEIEEGAVADVKKASDIPGWARVTVVMPKFETGTRWTEVIYTRQKPPWPGGEPDYFREVFEW